MELNFALGISLIFFFVFSYAVHRLQVQPPWKWVAIVFVGLIVYLVRLLPIDPPFKTAIIAVVIVICIIWLLGGLSGHPVLVLR